MFDVLAPSLALCTLFVTLCQVSGIFYTLHQDSKLAKQSVTIND